MLSKIFLKVNYLTGAKFLSALNDGSVNEAALSVETLGEIYGPIQKRARENIEKQERLVREIQVCLCFCSLILCYHLNYILLNFVYI